MKEDLFGPVNDDPDDVDLDIEASISEGTHLMRQDTVDITEQEISNQNVALKKAHGGSDDRRLQMHRPTVQVMTSLMNTSVINFAMLWPKYKMSRK